ncbi:D-alanyl-lipoteichoic acid acyltransferase DltB, MBOAT superfamily [Butyrivibrio proteoclasticus]|uniref:D-alanyl-lipoteichoic acid acyltransferase DltB, MBOAT superfamily n=2 Tax=Butyrivibrio proteoclasticus TaxID=43305 RepID=A0A1I5PXM8_9FIRM|nr:D-alanyl-lipoteichoic acid acyltransferase DltB, MBOAT superfamily [Butyrivibrio proteoclasticus]
MQFNSYEFILYFLPITVLLYFVANKINPIIGKIVIVVASVIFYSMGRINMLGYLGISMLINYGSALAIRKFKIKTKFLTALPIIVNVGLLLYFKYMNFAITNVNIFFGKEIELKEIILPLGISFYTFQQIAYIVATEQGNLENNNIIDYMAYILYFPKLVMGPIIDPVDYISQINQVERKKADITNITIGIKLFSLGLIKKVLLADTFAKAVSWAYTNIDATTAMDCILLILFYTFEIYFDFSGYSDMAVGVSSMLNIDLPINFDSPYKAISIRDFWKRWHISLTKFLTKYIYIPLGGSRKGIIFTYINTLIVFIVSGLWHGANWTFILWGLLHGLFSCFDRMFEKLEERVFMPVRWLCTFGVVSVLWLLFSASTVEQWRTILFKILFMQSTEVSEGMISSFNLVENQFLYNLFGLNWLPTNVRGFNMLIFIIVACFICFVPGNNYRNKDKLSIGTLVVASVAFIWGVLCLGAESTFVYFGF